MTVLPAAPVFLSVIATLHSGSPPPRGAPDPWLLYGQSVLILWATILLPLFVALETGLLAGLEHHAAGFKHLFALPVRRGVVYTAKGLMVLGLIGVATLAVWGWMQVGGFALRWIRPELAFGPAPPWAGLLCLAAVSWLGCWPMIGLHLWISLRWSSLILNVGVAIAGMMLGLAAIRSEVWTFHPWSLPARLENLTAKSVLRDGSWGLPAAGQLPLMLAVLGGAAVLAAAIVHLSRRDVA